MTSQTLIPISASDLQTSQIVNNQLTATMPEGDRTSTPPGSAVSDLGKLPYQTTHQLELLHLRAEVEALIQHLQFQKQQRLVSAGK
jgi:hypothetical protein